MVAAAFPPPRWLRAPFAASSGMFDSLSTRLGAVFDRLRGRGALSEADVGEAMREIRIALLEADVALPVVKDFVAKVRERAVGQEVLKSITPGQMVVKIVHDELVAVLGSDESAPRLGGPQPSTSSRSWPGRSRSPRCPSSPGRVRSTSPAARSIPRAARATTS